MAFDEGLVQRVREVLEQKTVTKERNMFGGVCFLNKGNMVCGIINDDLIIRVGLVDYDKLLNKEHTKKFDVTGKVLKGWVMVSHEGHHDDKELDKWVSIGVKFASSLPPKSA